MSWSVLFCLNIAVTPLNKFRWHDKKAGKIISKLRDIASLYCPGSYTTLK